ncbi:MAG: metal ABC transporter substrate-binding protein, partial [Actinobacteria bacterium]|nr:metal ABC transporter substrate-binding protein [Actinomycetota bacterium]
MRYSAGAAPVTPPRAVTRPVVAPLAAVPLVGVLPVAAPLAAVRALGRLVAGRAAVPLAAAGAAARLAVVLLAVVLSAGLPVAGGCGGPAASDGRPLVVTSVPLIYSLTANVAGEAVRVEELLPPGASPHQTNFTPAQARLLAEADMLIVNGAGLELWVDDLVKSSGNPDLRVVVASKGVTLLRPNEPTPIPGSAGGGESTGGADPHVWLDPANALVMVDNIRAALKALDPSGAAGYARRAPA